MRPVSGDRRLEVWIQGEDVVRIDAQSLEAAAGGYLAAHVSPCFINPKEGDIVTVGQCRPLSKTVRFNVIAHEPSANQALNVKKQFRVF